MFDRPGHNRWYLISILFLMYLFTTAGNLRLAAKVWCLIYKVFYTKYMNINAKNSVVEKR